MFIVFSSSEIAGGGVFEGRVRVVVFKNDSKGEYRYSLEVDALEPLLIFLFLSLT